MPSAAQNLPDDPSQLKDMVTTVSGECGALMGELQSRDILIEKLKHQLAGTRQHRFGSRSEVLEQLPLTLEDEEIAASAQEPAPADAINRQRRQRTSPNVNRCPIISRATRQHCRRGIPVGNAVDI